MTARRNSGQPSSRSTGSPGSAWRRWPAERRPRASLRVHLLGQPSLDQRLVWNVAFVRGNLDPLQQRYGKAQRDGGRRRFQIGKTDALRPTPVDVFRGIVSLPKPTLLGLALE